MSIIEISARQEQFPRKTQNGQIVAFGKAGSENDLARLYSEERSYPRSRVFKFGSHRNTLFVDSARISDEMLGLAHSAECLR